MLLQQAAIFLLTAVIVVPLFRRLRLGGVLGYLAAGAIIGPWGLALIADAKETLHFAELGVVLLLFLVGLELEPSRLWALRKPVFGLGGAQVVVSGIALGVAAHVLGLAWQPAIVVGFGLAMSSTAIVLAWLGERGQLSEPARAPDVRRAAVPGPGGHSADRVAAAARARYRRNDQRLDGRRQRCRRHRRRDRRQPPRHAAGAQAHRALRRSRGVHRAPRCSS